MELPLFILLLVCCCAATEKSKIDILYYANPSVSTIYRVPASGGVESLYLGRPHCNWPHGMAHDQVSDCIYWSNTGSNRGIGRICQGNVSSVALPGYIRAIAVDPAQDLVYATFKDTIEIINFDQGTSRTLVSGITNPYDIALDSEGGWIYWADFHKHHISKARTNGTGHVPLVEKGFRYPAGVALGQNNSRLYFCGEHSVQSVGVDGIGYQTHFRDNAHIFQTIAVDSQFLYLRSNRIIWRLAIDSVDATRRDLEKIIDTGRDYVGGMVVVETLLEESQSTGDCEKRPCVNNEVCQQLSTGPECVCPPGFGGATCNIDLCETRPCFNGGTCVRVQRYRHCICPLGFTGSNCSLEGEGMLYYAVPSLNDIKRVPVSGGVPKSLNLSKPHCDRPYGIAHDQVHGCIYWTNTGLNKGIGRICQGNVSSVALPGYKRAIAVDPAHDLVYATDTSKDTIEIINFDQGTSRTLVSGITDPYEIALDSEGGWIYWADFHKHQIGKARTNGTGHVPLVEKNFRYPAGVALGQNNSRLYFCGEHSIQSIGVDGIGYQTHFHDNAHIFNSMAVDSQFLYVKSNRLIWRLAIDSVYARGHDLKVITDTGKDYIGGMVVVETLLEETTTPATSNPATSTPAASTPAASTPAASTPAASTPATSTPAASTPATSTPAASAPATSTPATSTPAASTPAISTPVASTPATSTPATSTPATSTSASPSSTESGSSNSQDNYKYVLLVVVPNVLVLIVALCTYIFSKSGKCGKCRPNQLAEIELPKKSDEGNGRMEDQQEDYYEIMPIDIPHPPPRPHTRTQSAAVPRHDILSSQRPNLPPQFGTYLTPPRADVSQPQSSASEPESPLYNYATDTSNKPTHLAKPKSSAAYLTLEEGPLASPRPDLPPQFGTYLTPPRADVSQPQSSASEPESPLYNYATDTSNQPTHLAKPKSSAAYLTLVEGPLASPRPDLEFGTYLTPPRASVSQPESGVSAEESQLPRYDKRAPPPLPEMPALPPIGIETQSHPPSDGYTNPIENSHTSDRYNRIHEVPSTDLKTVRYDERAPPPLPEMHALPPIGIVTQSHPPSDGYTNPIENSHTSDSPYLELANNNNYDDISSYTHI